ncbi:MAG: aspartate kinase [Ignavibacteria bacterium]|nr:aspartate kinase [Ignavibacteria bacterium]
MNVLKFGGTSVATADAMRQVRSIIEPERGSVVVLSACGGVTNRLLEAVRKAGFGESETSTAILQEIEERHVNLCNELFSNTNILHNVLSNVKKLCMELRVFCQGVSLLGECTARSLDAAASYGERLSTLVFSKYCTSVGMKVQLFDAREIMRTDSEYLQAKINFPALQQLALEKLIPLLSSGEIVITQGFIGSDDNGVTTTLGRGGSDLSAALIGAAIAANNILIYTDVSGVASADPRIIPTAKPIPVMSFSEARELSFYGAKVLHPETILPAVERGIPVRVLNTFAPGDAGTLIVARRDTERAGLSAVTLKKECSMLRVHGVSNINQHAELYHQLSEITSEVYATLSGESVCTVIFSASKLDREALIAHFSDWKIDVDSCTLLCAVGARIDGTTVTEFTKALGEFEPWVVISGSSNGCLLAVLPPAVAVAALQAVHDCIIAD